MVKIQYALKIELQEKILPFWCDLIDSDLGGFYGEVDTNNVINPKADKGVIFNSRLLWTFSSAYRIMKKPQYLKMANHAYQFMINHLIDDQFNGLYWMVNYKGEPIDKRKHIYNQAFGIYALSEYYKINPKEEVLEIAYSLFNIIERIGKDDLGYLEEFTETWEPQSNEMLSENGVIAHKTMNTHLHILEAYTTFYEITHDQNVKDAIKWLLDIFKKKIYNDQHNYLQVFFDNDFNSILELQSYGHDIEATWLIDRAIDVIADKKYKSHYKYTALIAENVYKNAFIKNSVINENEKGEIDCDRIWWVQAEAIIGFLNHYHKTDDKKYSDAIENIWNYIKTYISPDHLPEWYWRVNKDGKHYEEDLLVEPWKSSYHNGRMCLEIIERMMYK